jgi:hypothetical protein
MTQGVVSFNARLSSLHNREQGRQCILVCNGPSLNQMDLRFLRKHICIGLNKIFLGFKKFGFYPKYYVAVNDLVVQQSTTDIKALNCIKFISNRSASLIPESAFTYHINTSQPASRFCKDISQGVHEGWTVTYAALQIAYFLGFERVVIIGMDHRYTFEGKANQTSLMVGDDPNHFASNYFSGQRWDNPDLAHSEESYRLAKQVFEADGRSIIDATLNGACTVFDKQHYTQVFQNEL